MKEGSIGKGWKRVGILFSAAACAMGFTMTSCARMPYTTKTVHDDERVVVTVQREIEPQTYTHPIQLTSAELAAILKGFSVREDQRLPLRWFAEELPPKPLFRHDEIEALTPHLSDALQQLSPNERAHFEVRGPGNNPRYGRDTVAGWMAVRDPHLYLKIEYFHNQIAIRKSDNYDYNYPLTPPTPKTYILYFEPGRFWVTDGQGTRAVDYREFLKSGQAGGTITR